MLCVCVCVAHAFVTHVCTCDALIWARGKVYETVCDCVIVCVGEDSSGMLGFVEWLCPQPLRYRTEDFYDSPWAVVSVFTYSEYTCVRCSGIVALQRYGDSGDRYCWDILFLFWKWSPTKDFWHFSFFKPVVAPLSTPRSLNFKLIISHLPSSNQCSPWWFDVMLLPVYTTAMHLLHLTPPPPFPLYVSPLQLQLVRLVSNWGWSSHISLADRWPFWMTPLSSPVAVRSISKWQLAFGQSETVLRLHSRA